jgi:hypothetical protein
MFGNVHWQTEILTRPATTAATLAADNERENANLPFGILFHRNISGIVAQEKT